MPRIFLLGLQEDVAVGDLLVALAAVEVQVVDVVDALHIHGEPLQPVGQLAGDRRAFDAADLLEIGELRHFHAVAPAFPAEPPGAERRAFPIVLDEADVVQQRIDADRRQRAEIELLQIGRVRLQDHLVLVIMLQPVGVLAVAAVLRPARGLHVGGVPAPRPERAQRRRRMEGAGADLHVVGLQDRGSHSPPSNCAASGSAPGRSGSAACAAASWRSRANPSVAMPPLLAAAAWSVKARARPALSRQFEAWQLQLLAGNDAAGIAAQLRVEAEYLAGSAVPLPSLSTAIDHSDWPRWTV